jgi:hypothetical protein
MMVNIAGSHQLFEADQENTREHIADYFRQQIQHEDNENRSRGSKGSRRQHEMLQMEMHTKKQKLSD